MAILNREVIEEFKNPLSSDVATFAVKWTIEALSEIIEKMKKKYPAISSQYEFMLGGDFLTKTTNANTVIEIFILLKSPQLELNSIKLVDNKFKQLWHRVKMAYKSYREEKATKRKLKKMQLKEKQKEEIFEPNKFSILNFKKQLVSQLVEQIDSNSYILITQTGFKIIARDFLGVDVNVYPVISLDNNFKVFNEITGKFNELSFEDFNQNINEKTEKVGEIYFDIVRVFKNLYFNTQSKNASAFFIESLIYNCPDSLFFGNDFYEVFIKILNYLKNAKTEDFVLITNKSKKLFVSKNINESLVILSNFVKQIDNML